MEEAGEITDIKATLNEVRLMLDEMRSYLITLSEDQALWIPSGEKVWPIQRSVSHCVNCEHRAVIELQRAIEGHSTPETIPADTGIFAWFGPTPYALARMIQELKGKIGTLCEALDTSHVQIEAIRYPNHPPRKLIDYVKVMHSHTERHLEAVRKKMTGIPAAKEFDDEIRKAYPNFGRGAQERGAT